MSQPVIAMFLKVVHIPRASSNGMLFKAKISCHSQLAQVPHASHLQAHLVSAAEPIAKATQNVTKKHKRRDRTTHEMSRSHDRSLCLYPTFSGIQNLGLCRF